MLRNSALVSGFSHLVEYYDVNEYNIKKLLFYNNIQEMLDMMALAYLVNVFAFVAFDCNVAYVYNIHGTFIILVFFIGAIMALSQDEIKYCRKKKT